MGWFKKIAISFYVGYLLLVFLNPSYFVHHCLKEQKTEIIKNLKEKLDDGCPSCAGKHLAEDYKKGFKTDEHSCCEQSHTSDKLDNLPIPYNNYTHVSHHTFNSECCSFSVVQLNLEYITPEKITGVNLLNFVVSDINFKELIANLFKPLYSKISLQIRLPSKEFLSKLLATIYFTSLAR